MTYLKLFYSLLLIAVFTTGFFLLNQFSGQLQVKAAEPIKLYVSPLGDDNNDGSATSPFNTLEKARQHVRTINKSMTSDIFVYLQKGTYSLETPLVFDGDDSGFNGNYVRYISEFSTDRPFIHGGKEVTGWEQVGNLWRAPLNTTAVRQLYLNGERRVRAKTDGTLANFQMTSTGLVYPNNQFAALTNPQDVEVVINQYFLHFRCPLQSISGQNLTVKPSCWNAANTYKINDLEQPEWLENAYEFLDREGEWYWNKSDGYIYYLPKSGEQIQNSSFIVPVLDKLIDGKGTVENPIKNLVFQNVDFGYAGYSNASQYGYIGLSGIHTVKNATIASPPLNEPIAANISFSNSQGVWLIRNGFYHLGAAALKFERGSKNNMVIGNVFTDASAHALIMGDNNINDLTLEGNMTAGNHIKNNYIHDVGLEFFDANAVYTGFSKDTVISNNYIHDVPYAGISLAFERNASYSQNNLISKNLIHDAVKTMVDSGSIFVKGIQPNSQIVDNVTHDQHQLISHLYLDTGSDGFYVSRNISYNINKILQNSPYGTYGVTLTAKGCNNLIEGNYWPVPGADSIQARSGLWDGSPCPGSGTVLRNNTVITSPSQAPQSIIAAAGLESTYQDIKNFPPPVITQSADLCSQATIIPSQISPQPQGSSYQFNATSDCGRNAKYRWWIQKKDQDWQLAQEYNASNSHIFSWNTLTQTAGSYQIGVWVQPASGPVFMSAPTLPFTLSTDTSASCNQALITPQSTSPQSSGGTYTFNATSNCGEGSSYQWWVLSPGGNWQVVQDWGNSSFNWNTSGKNAGDYHIGVWAKSANGAVFGGAPESTFTLINSCNQASITPLSTSPQPKGGTYQFNATSNCGPTAQYRFWVYSSATGWVMKQDYSTSNVFNWNTSGLTAGTYQIGVHVRTSPTATPFMGAPAPTFILN